MRVVLSLLGFLAVAPVALAQTGAPLGAPSGAQRVPDPRQGAGLARDWCASCHVIGTEPGGRGTDAVPSFPSIARDPAKGPEYVRRILAGPHPPMPPMPLSRASVDDIVAYFKTLATPR